MIGLWIYVLITCILFVFSIVTHNLYSIILFMLWCMRLLKLKHLKVFIMSCFVLCIVFCSLRLSINKQSQLTAQITETSMTILADTLKVNGNHLTGKGVINDETVLVSKTIQTEDEQLMWQRLSDNLCVNVIGNMTQIDSNRNEHQFNYQNYLKEQQHIFWSFSIDTLQITDRQFNFIAFWKNKILEHAPELLAAIMNSIIFSDAPELLQDTLSHLGILYLIVASGIHVKLILDGLEKVCYRLHITRELTQKLLCVITLILCYLGNFKLSLLKFFLLKLIGKRLNYLDKLSLIGILFLFINPYVLFSVSFQFTVIISLLAYLCQYHPLKIWLCTIPFLSFHFFQFHLLTVPIAYIFFIWVRCILLPLSYTSAILLLLIPKIIVPFLQGIDGVLAIIMHFLEWIDSLHGLKFITGRLYDWQYLFVCICLLSLLKQPKFNKVFLCQMILFFIALCPLPKYQVMMIDVGQGNSFLIQNGYEVILMDTGGDMTFHTKKTWQQTHFKPLAKRILLPTLWAQGISKINTVFISHSDSDHSGALEDLKQLIPIGDIIFGKGANINGTKSVDSPQTFHFSHQFNMQLLYVNPNGRGKNDDSLILYFKFGPYYWLFMGDAGIAVEEKLIQLYPDLKVDVLQVGHHGSKTSTGQKFIDYYHPQIALISVGVNNRFNHPNQDVLDRLKLSKIFRTDEQGMVIYKETLWKKEWYTIMSNAEK